jgi:hypothetical protein
MIWICYQVTKRSMGFKFVQSMIGLGLTFVLGLGYFTFALLLRRKRMEQPIKSKAPRLLLLSLVANALGVVGLCGTIVVGIAVEEYESRVWMLMHCGVVLSEVVCAPLMYAAYIARYGVGNPVDLPSCWPSSPCPKKRVVNC